jgi:PKD repeat protein
MRRWDSRALSIRHGGARRPGRTRGQALPEFALALPVFVLVVLIGLDFGRALTAWVGLEHSARIAANYVSVNPTAWDGSHPHGWHDTQQQMETLLYNDAATSNCTKRGSNWLTIDVSAPSNTSYQAGDPATVTIRCDFDLITPFMGWFLPDPLEISVGASFPIRTTVVSNIVGHIVVRFYAVKISGTVACPNPCYEFHDLSSPAPTSWAWTFGDSGTSSASQPTHSYAAPGLYSVGLTVVTSEGTGSWSTILNVSAADFPVAGFSRSPGSGTAPLDVQFVDTSSPTPTSWAWDFDGNGTTDSTLQNPNHTYTTAGTYTVKLTVNGGSFHTDSVSVSTATPPPTANFTYSPTSGITPLFVQFTDTSTGSPTSWAWDLNGDSITDSTAPNPTYTYSVAGTYTVSLVATNQYGPSSPKTATVTVTSDSCAVPNFINDSYGHNGQAAFQTAETAKWQAVQTGGVHFVSTPTFSPLLTSKGGRVTSQSRPAGQITSCSAATIQLTGNW